MYLSQKKSKHFNPQTMNLFQEKPAGLLDHLFLNIAIQKEPKIPIPAPIIEKKNDCIPETKEKSFVPPDLLQEQIEQGTYQFIVLVSENLEGMRKIERAGSFSECRRRYNNALKENKSLKMKFFDCSGLNVSKLCYRWEEFLAANFPNEFKF